MYVAERNLFYFEVVYGVVGYIYFFFIKVGDLGGFFFSAVSEFRFGVIIFKGSVGREL